MKKLINLCFFCCLLCDVSAQVFPVTLLKNNGPSDKRINLVFVGDGYTSAEQAQFITNATSVMNATFAQSPFLEYEPYFNVYAIQVPSVQSGAKHAGTATDVIEPASPVISPNNYFGSRFDVSNIHRLLVPANGASILNVMASNTPFYDQIFILVNSTVYGGSGGTFATSSINASAGEIAIHEIGHSFANLGDEYWFNCAERKNRTANNNPATVIWKNWLAVNGVNIYTISGSSPPCYRPHQNCKMQVLGSPFCSVCKEAFIDKIYSLLSPIESFLPANNTVSFVGPTMNFSMDLINPIPNTLKVVWKLNGTTIANNVDNVNIAQSSLNVGANTLLAQVTDSTGQSRSYWPATSGYLNSVTWTVNLVSLPIELLQFEARLEQNKVALLWVTERESNSDYFEVQKSKNGVDFYPIGQVKAAGNSNTKQKYAFTDLELPNGVVYYRLLQADRDGTTTASPIVTLNRVDKMHYEIFPNPVVDILGVELSTQYVTDISLSLYDMEGRLLTQLTRENTDFTLENIDMTDMKSGNYILRIQVQDAVIDRVITKI